MSKIVHAKLPDRRWKIEIDSEEALEELIARTSIEAHYNDKLLHVVDLIRANRRYPHCAEAVKQWRQIARTMRAYIRMKAPWGEMEREYQFARAIYWEGNARYIAPLARTGTTLPEEAAAAQRLKEKRDAHRTAESTKTKRERADSHWSGKWLTAAHEKQPKLGAELLALAARKMLAKMPDDPDHPKCAEITEYRAKRFLAQTRGP